MVCCWGLVLMLRCEGFFFLFLLFVFVLGRVGVFLWVMNWFMLGLWGSG